MITLNTLEFRNCFAYGDQETQRIELNKNNLTQLVGANGSAKSSVALVLEELFYSKNSKGVAKGDIPNRYTKEPRYFMGSDFSVDGVEYKLTKDVHKANTKLVLLKNGIDISGHTATQTYKLLHEILNLDYNTFSKLVYQSMTSSLDFLTATDTARKNFLINLLELDRYVEVEKELKERRKELATEIKGLEASAERAANIAEKTQVPELQFLVEEPTLSEDYEKQVDALNYRLGSLQSSIDEHGKEVNRFNEYVRKSKELDAELEKTTKALESLVEVPEPRQPEEPPELARLPELEDNLKKVLWEMESVKKQYKDSKEVSDKTECSACGSKLDTDSAEKLTETLRQKFVGLAEVRDSLIPGVEELRQLSVSHQRAISEFNREYQARAKYINSKETLTRKLKELDNTYLDKVEEPSPIEDIREEQEQVTAEISKLRGIRRSEELELSEARKYNLEVEKSNSTREQALRSKEMAVAEYEKLQGALRKAQEYLSQVDTLCAIFGPKGLIGYKIESSVKVFEERLNDYLSKLSGGHFALAFELEDAKLKVVVYSSSKEVSIKTLSSGELSKVNIATLLAIRNLMSSISKTHINTLFLDEITSVIDAEGMEDLIQVLLREPELNTFLVSHGYEHPLVDVIHVEKINNISHLRS